MKDGNNLRIRQRSIFLALTICYTDLRRNQGSEDREIDLGII